jgi:hypothetical protein
VKWIAVAVVIAALVSGGVALYINHQHRHCPDTPFAKCR